MTLCAASATRSTSTTADSPTRGDSDLAAGCAHLPNQIGHDRAEVG
jgi:hypothetical protein